MTSSTTGDRRWGTTRRSGMTILGKVAVPKPINLPSQRLENQGLDPNVEIVPKGTLSWGSKSSLNAWGTSSLSTRTESGPGSPSHLSNRPSSGGSVTRPSTADSNKALDSSSSVAWDSNSRPSSASGVFPSNQASVALQRPHSADTRPGSSQLSRFAEPVSETSATWGQHVPGEKLGVAPLKNDGFSLTSGDFPSLGTEKESSEKSTRPQGLQQRFRLISASYPEEWGGIPSKELQEAIMLEKALFSGVAKENISYNNQPRIHKESQSPDKKVVEEESERSSTTRKPALPIEPSVDNEDAITLLVRMPDSSRHGRRFLKSDKLKYLFDFIDAAGLVKPGTYRVVRPYPRRAFSLQDGALTFEELSLTNKQEALFLELLV